MMLRIGLASLLTRHMRIGITKIHTTSHHVTSLHLTPLPTDSVPDIHGYRHRVGIGMDDRRHVHAARMGRMNVSTTTAVQL